MGPCISWPVSPSPSLMVTAPFRWSAALPCSYRKLSMATIPEVFATAVQEHRKGNLQQAERDYRQVLQAEPCNVLALHFLGVLALQVGRHDLAVDYIGEAARLQPSYVEAHNNLGI